MGEVYIAEDVRLGRKVALKTPRRSVLEEPQLLARFLREARASAGLRHHNICPVYEVNQVQGIHYIALAFIDGKPLSEMIGDPRWRSPREIAAAIRRIALALDVAHAAGVVHRDLKPANVIIDAAGEPIVMDFGLARQFLSEDDSRFTQEGTILGTPAYMSPEQVRSEPERVGPASDVYSLGVILFELLTGRLPFRGPLMSMLLEVANDAKRPPRPSSIRPDIDRRLEAICLKMISKPVAGRYASMREVVAALAEYEAQPTARPGSHTASGSRSRPLLAALAAAAIVLGVIVITIRNRDGSTRTIEASDTSHVSIERKEKAATPTLPASDTTTPEKPVANETPAVADTPASIPKPSRVVGAVPAAAVAPFDAVQARRHQEAWANHLNIPVHFTNSLGIKFVLIPPGEFLMGTSEEEIRDVVLILDENDTTKRRAARSELPRHKVVLTRPFYLGTHEITQQQYQDLTGTNPSGYVTTSPDPDIRAKLGGRDTTKHPVDSISWRNAIDFCNRVSRRESLKPAYFRDDYKATVVNRLGYRLPTEAEWEFACRAGTTTAFWSGDDYEQLEKLEWTGANSGLRPHDVGELKPNPFGLYDMLGNVSEWVYDAWKEDGYAAFDKTPTDDPTGPTDEVLHRCTRGGNFHFNVIQARSGARFVNDPGVGFVLGGIRLVLPVEMPLAGQAASPDKAP
jgi:formylglycine-generating enzyme required for sulfatase activity/serine/threonine protein kinase